MIRASTAVPAFNVSALLGQAARGHVCVLRQANCGLAGPRNIDISVARGAIL
jgi:hypothetical protein